MVKGKKLEIEKGNLSSNDSVKSVNYLSIHTDDKGDLNYVEVGFDDGLKTIATKNSNGTFTESSRISTDPRDVKIMGRDSIITLEKTLNLMQDFKNAARIFYIDGKKETKEEFDKIFINFRLRDMKLDSKEIINSDIEFSKSGKASPFYENNDLKVLKSISNDHKKRIEEMEKGGFDDTEYKKLEKIAEEARAKAKKPILKTNSI